MFKTKKGFLKILSMVAVLSLFIASVSVLSANATPGLYQPEIATWEGWCTAAATFTFDDGAPCHITDVAPAFDAYGYKATFYLVTSWKPNWTGFAGLAANGHEIGSHSDTHSQNMSGEEASSKTNIEKNIGKSCLTVAYPNCNVPNVSAVTQNYIAGRIGQGSWAGVEDIMGVHGPTDWCRVPSFLTGSEGSVETTNDFTAKMQAAIHIGGWVTFLTHGLAGKTNGNATYSPTDFEAIKDALAWAHQNRIWVTSMCNAAMYVKERDASTLAIKYSDSSSAAYTLTHSIADNVCKYQYPLSVRVPLPSGWSGANVTQNKAPVDSEVRGGMVYFSAVPNGGDIVLTDPVVSATVSGQITSFNPDDTTTVSLTQDGIVKYSTTIAAASGTGKITQDFAIADVLAGAYTMRVSKAKHATCEYPVIVNGDTVQNAELHLYGDVNGDEKIDSTDARLILQYYAKKIGEGDLNTAAADVNADGKVDSTDARLILQLYAKKISEF